MRSKGVKIIAMGVENEEQEKRLHTLEIDYLQGIFISQIENIG